MIDQCYDIGIVNQETKSEHYLQVKQKRGNIEIGRALF